MQNDSFAEQFLIELKDTFGPDLFAYLRYAESRIRDEGALNESVVDELFLRLLAEFDLLRDKGLVDAYRHRDDLASYRSLLKSRTKIQI